MSDVLQVKLFHDWSSERNEINANVFLAAIDPARIVSINGMAGPIADGSGEIGNTKSILVVFKSAPDDLDPPVKMKVEANLIKMRMEAKHGSVAGLE